MKRSKKHMNASPWIAVGAAVAGLVVGYGLVVAKHPVNVMANGASCPNKEVCSGADCEKNDCANCKGTCPNCKGKNA